MMGLLHMSKQNIVIDSTILNNLQSCAYKTLLRQESNLEKIGPGSETLENGILMHKFQEMYNFARFNELPHTECVAYALDNVTPVVLEGQGYKELDIRDFEIIREKFIDYTKNDPKHREWIITSKPEERVVKVLFEDEFIKIIWVSLIDVQIRARDGSTIPVDYKTEKRRSDPDKKSNQFIGYCWAKDVNHMLVAKIGLQKSLPPNEKYRVYPISYTNEEINEWKKEVVHSCRQLLGYYVTEFWPLNRTSCFKYNRMCTFSQICEATPSDRQRIIETYYTEGRKWNPLEDGNRD